MRVKWASSGTAQDDRLTLLQRVNHGGIIMRNHRLSLWILGAASVSWLAAATMAVQADENRARRLLFFNRSAGFQHSVVTVKDDQPCYAETILRPICDKHHWELVSTKDGTVFTPENIAKYDAFLFYTTGVLTDAKSADGSKPMSKAGKQAFLDAIHNGKGFVGFHCASDTFHKGERYETQTPGERDPYINMLGGEFVTHCSQQPATMKVVDPNFPAPASWHEFQEDGGVVFAQELWRRSTRHPRE